MSKLIIGIRGYFTPMFLHLQLIPYKFYFRIYPFMDKSDGVNFFHNVYDMLDEMTPRKTRVRYHDSSSHSEIKLSKFLY